MRRDVHPTYGPVAFRDRSGDLLFTTRSTLVASLPDDAETVEVDGTQVPVVDVEISSASHPFWTGRGRVVDSEGRVEAFRRRYGAGR